MTLFSLYFYCTNSLLTAGPVWRQDVNGWDMKNLLLLSQHLAFFLWTIADWPQIKQEKVFPHFCGTTWYILLICSWLNWFMAKTKFSPQTSLTGEQGLWKGFCLFLSFFRSYGAIHFQGYLGAVLRKSEGVRNTAAPLTFHDMPWL